MLILTLPPLLLLLAVAGLLADYLLPLIAPVQRWFDDLPLGGYYNDN